MPLDALARSVRLTVLVLALSGCVGASVDAAPGPAPAVDEVQQLIGSANCTRDADCRTTPVGQRACGGPDRYVAWSVRGTDEAALEAAIARASASQAAANAKNNRMSTCVFVADPGARCVAPLAAQLAPRCVLANSAEAPSSR